MTAEQARVIIGNEAQFRTWQEWVGRGRPTAYNLARALDRPESTVSGHLVAAQMRLNRWAMTQADAQGADSYESAHAAECRELSCITLAEGHTTRTVSDKVGKKVLLRSSQ